MPEYDGSYNDNGDGTVTDNATKLMWQQLHGTVTSEQGGVTYCATLSLAGYSDWRLPTRIELVSIEDYQRSVPSINYTYFTDWKLGTLGAFLFAADPTSTGAYRFIDFYRGEDGTIGGGGSSMVRCVR